MQDHECMRQEFSCETAIIIKMIARNVLNVLCEDLQGKREKDYGGGNAWESLEFYKLASLFLCSTSILHTN